MGSCSPPFNPLWDHEKVAPDRLMDRKESVATLSSFFLQIQRLCSAAVSRSPCSHQSLRSRSRLPRHTVFANSLPSRLNKSRVPPRGAPSETPTAYLMASRGSRRKPRRTACFLKPHFVLVQHVAHVACYHLASQSLFRQIVGSQPPLRWEFERTRHTSAPRHHFADHVSQLSLVCTAPQADASIFRRFHSAIFSVVVPSTNSD